MIREAIQKVTQGQGLSQGEMSQAIVEIMEGQATQAQVAGLLVGLKMKGETAAEIAGCVQGMLSKAHQVDRSDLPGPLVDTCGTGGDNLHTFNISTVAAFVVAGAGIRVAKHGNRSVSSKCGSADLLEALGFKIDLGPDQVKRCMQEVGIGFLFAPTFHPAMAQVAPIRKELGVRTIFNVAGPLSNPARVECQLTGVYSEALLETVAEVLKLLGTQHALIVHGADGLDEVSLSGPTKLIEVNAHGVRPWEPITPQMFGLEPARLDKLVGGDAATNAKICQAVLGGRPGPYRDAVVLNAGCALYVAGRAQTIQEGVTLAQGAIDSHQAQEKLAKLRELTRNDPR